jgi:hypothetical protein
MSTETPPTGRQFVDCPTTETHQRHMANLRGIATTQGRREYIDGVRRSEGNFAAKWLEDEFRAEFNARKAEAKP